MSKSGVNRPNLSDPVKPNRYNPEFYWKNFIFEKKWFRRGLHYNAELTVSGVLSLVALPLMAAALWYVERHNDEYRPYIRKYTVIRERDVVPRKAEKGLYN